VKWLGVIGTCSVVLPMPCEVARCDWDHGVTLPKPCEVASYEWDYGGSLAHTM
jgi:hypothetical protein